MDMNNRLKQAYNSIKSQSVDFEPKIAIVCGSGLADIAENVESIYAIPFKLIKGMPTSTVEGHDGRFVFGYVDGVPVVVMQGRVHYYEGYSSQEVVMPIRLMQMLGAKFLLLTNAAGGITYTNSGDLMLISDHILYNVPSPLIGNNLDNFGVRFPDMSEVYDKELSLIAKKVAEKIGIELKEGVYMQFSGPQYETPAEIKMAKAIGADAVGMSTAIEAIAAHHANMRVIALSCISNAAAGISSKSLNHEEVINNMKVCSSNVLRLGREFINEIKSLL